MQRQGAGYLSDVLMWILPPELVILIIKAHQGQHTSGQQTVGVLLHVLPCGRQCQSMRKVLEAQVQHSWGQPLSLQSMSEHLMAGRLAKVSNCCGI